MATKGTNSISRTIVWVIMGLLVVGLGGFGAANFGGSIRSVGSVGEVDIDVNRYANALNSELQALSQQVGQNIPLSQAQALGLDQQVLQRLVSAAATQNETMRIGVSVGDAEVLRQVVSARAFQGLDGKFDPEAYAFALSQSGQSKAAFEATLRAETAGSILQTAVSGSVPVPATYARTIVSYLGERRSFSWLELDGTLLTDPLPEPDLAALEAFHTGNAALFTRPEAKRITYAWLSPEALVSQMEVSDDRLQQAYEARGEEYNQPERRLVERLVFGNEAEAIAAADAIAAGTSSFEDQVAARGLELADIDLGDLRREDLGAAADAVFALTGPGIAGPAMTDLGPALFRVNAILPARATPLDDVREDLKLEVAMDMARRRISDEITDFDDLLAGGATLEELAEERAMQLGRIDWYAGLTEDIAAYGAFGDAALAVQSGDFPEILELEDGGIFAIRLDEILPAELRPFDEVSDAVEVAWRDDALLKALRSEAEVLRAQLDNGASLSSLGYPVTVETHVLRTSFVEGLPADLLPQIFEAETGTIVMSENDTSLVIAQLGAIQPADPADPDMQLIATQVDAQIANAMSNDLLAAFDRALQAQTEISLNSAAINAVHAQFH